MPPTPFTLISGNAVGTSDFGLDDRRSVQLHDARSRRRAGSCSPSRCATTCTWARRRPGSSAAAADQRHPAGSRPAAVPRGDARVARRTTRARSAPTSCSPPATSRPRPCPVDLSKAGQLLERFGKYRRDYFVTRGNHDRAHDGRRVRRRAASASGRATTASTTSSSRATSRRTSRRELQGLRVLGIDTYDKPGRRQRRRRALDRAARLVPRRARQGPRPADDRVRPPSARRRRTRRSRSRRATRSTRRRRRRSSQDYARHPGLFLHHAGPHPPQQAHDQPASRPASRMQEIAAGKEYPGGFSLLRLHTGGFALNFYKTRSDLAREWSERSRQEILGALAAVRARQQRRRPQHRGRARPLRAAARLTRRACRVRSAARG